MNAHPANTWIAETWMNKKVKQVSGMYMGRFGVVRKTFFDEKGALHCCVEMDNSQKYADDF